MNIPKMQIVKNDVIKSVINGSKWYKRKMEYIVINNVINHVKT